MQRLSARTLQSGRARRNRDVRATPAHRHKLDSANTDLFALSNTHIYQRVNPLAPLRLSGDGSLRLVYATCYWTVASESRPLRSFLRRLFLFPQVTANSQSNDHRISRLCCRTAIKTNTHMRHHVCPRIRGRLQLV